MVARLARGSLALLLLAASIEIDGCSTALHSIGDPRPYDVHPRLPVDPWNMERVEMGAPLQVQMHDGRRLSGRFGGFERAPDSLYRARYDSWRADAPGGAGVPLGARIQWSKIGSAPDSGTFAGYDLYSVRVAGADGVVRILPMKKLNWIAAAGGAPVGADSLIAWSDAGRLPVVAGLRLGTTHGLTRVDLDQVSGMQVSGVPTALALAIVGGAAVVILIIAARQPRSPDPGCAPDIPNPYVVGLVVPDTPALANR